MAQNRGFERVAALQGGWAAWKQAGYPVEGDVLAERAALPATGAASALGDPDAPVIIHEFSDFQCGYCARHALETLPKIRESYIDAGLVYYVAHDFPLDFHANARLAAAAARCAGDQGLFWPFYRTLFQRQADWAGLTQEAALDTFKTLAGALDLDGAELQACVSGGRFEREIEEDLRAGQQAGVGGTPSFLLNGELLVGAYPYKAFAEKIESYLQGTE
ncbi:MAG: thioredoxin domain-containing protein [Anaerolineae bacterium]